MSCAGILYADSVSHTDSHSKHEVEEEKQSAPSGVVSFGKIIQIQKLQKARIWKPRTQTESNGVADEGQYNRIHRGRGRAR
jgi:hypothetical protein